MSIAGRDTTWSHGTHGATSSLTDFTTKTMEVTPNFNAEDADATVFGDGFRSYEPTFKNATIAVKYKYDDTLFGQLAAIYSNSDTVDFKLEPVGSAGPEVTGSMCITSFGVPQQIGSVQTIDIAWKASGEIAFA